MVGELYRCVCRGRRAATDAGRLRRFSTMDTAMQRMLVRAGLDFALANDGRVR